MTPDPRFNTAGQPLCSAINGSPGPCTPGNLANYGNNPTNNQEIQQTGGALPIVPLDWPPTATTPFLGGSALNNARAFWADTTAITPEIVRIDFSVNTCNACHGGETATNLGRAHHAVMARRCAWDGKHESTISSIAEATPIS